MKHPLFISKVFISRLHRNNNWFLYCKSWTSLAFGHLFAPLISVGCSVHYWVSCAISKGGFLRLHFCPHTFASLWGACLRFASLWRANSRGDSCVLGVHLSNVCWGLLFCLLTAFIFWIFVERTYFKSLLKVHIDVCLLNQSVHLLKVRWIFVYLRVCWGSTIDLCLMDLPKRSSFKILLKVNNLSKILLWTRGTCIKPGCLAWPPFCHRVNLLALWSSASAVPQK